MTHVNGRVGSVTWDLGQMSGSGKCGVRKAIFIGIVAGDNLSERCWLLFLYCLGMSSGKMANGTGRGRSGNIPCQMEKVVFQQTNRPWGGGDSITSSFQSHGRVGKRIFIISSAVKVVALFQTCLCVEFAPLPYVDLNKGPISDMADPYGDTTLRVMQLFFCLAHLCSPTKARYL